MCHGAWKLCLWGFSRNSAAECKYDTSRLCAGGSPSAPAVEGQLSTSQGCRSDMSFSAPWFQNWFPCAFLRVPQIKLRQIVWYIFCLLSLVWKKESSFLRSPCCLCVCESPLFIFEFLNQFYEIWYMYHGNGAYLSGVLHKSLLSLLGKISVKRIPLSLLGNGSVNTFP
jgi:hypothetical protein